MDTLTAELPYPILKRSELGEPSVPRQHRSVLEHKQAGMPCTPSLPDSSGLSSALILTKRACGSSSWAARFRIGTMAWQGPHQGAQKSTITGMSLRCVWRSKRRPSSSMGWPSNSLALHWPQTALRVGLSHGMRLTASQFGQTTWIVSDTKASVKPARDCGPACRPPPRR